MKPAPMWFVVLVLAAAVPMVVLAAQADSILRAAYDTESSALNWFYPAYIVASGALACICYHRRREVAWILLALMILTDLLLLLA